MQETRVPVYEALAADIKELGVECVFGLMSDDTAQLIAMIDSVGVRFYGARHENNAVSMAEGYAAATGRLGIVIIGRGPATTNSMNGANYANRTGSPVLMIYGDAPNVEKAANSVGPDRKSLDTMALLHAAGIKTFRANDAVTARRTFVQAAAAAQHGAAALLLPSNVQQAQVDPAATAPGSFEAAKYTPQPARDSALQAAVSLLEKSRKPLIIAGIGAHAAGAREEIIRLADHIGAALVTTMKAKDMFRDHPFNCGILGSFSNVGGRRLIEQADCVIAIGASLNQQTTSFATAIPEGLPVIHIDKNRPNIGRWFDADLGLVGDAKLITEQLLEKLPSRNTSEMEMRSEENERWLADFSLADDFEAMNTPRTMDARSLALELNSLLPADRNLVWDSGNMLGTVPYISCPGPSHFKHTGDSASIGMGFGTAMGFAAGTPDRTTVLLMGDGSFLMNMGELETVAREYIPLVIVLMNDCAYGAELHFLQDRGMPVQLSQFPDIDFAPVAESFGFEAFTVRTLNELRALAPTLGNPDGPVFLDCKINASVVAAFMHEGPAHAAEKP
ncbi:thiamine pyrophosphate-binding protein [Emcibacter sp.]|uniref:thiamine pyrophosphate-binding protein n=1 Tax=Emcibacter sp. TaxID=1979954 RepID=UPI002AA8BBC2|nr:thiamine pyrophosphate-binding protein [Emcibacter sp.]